LLTPGSRVDEYEILNRLGRGGMGEMYKARDTRVDRIVAVKVLPRDASDAPDGKAVSSAKHGRSRR
jgi:serine/threonine protein kinase